jgi:hypothetical protein
MPAVRTTDDKSGPQWKSVLFSPVVGMVDKDIVFMMAIAFILLFLFNAN